MTAAGFAQYPIAAAGTTTRVLELGSDGPPVLFLHGVGARADRWRRAMRHFADAGWHCYAVDFPGHGLAGKPSRFDYTVIGYRDFVESVLDELGLETVVLVGTSLGGHVAGAVTVRTPDRVLALVLVGPMGMLPVADDVLERLAVSIQDRTRSGVAAKLERLLVDTSYVTDRWIDEEVRINTSPGSDEAFASLAEYFRHKINDDLVAAGLQALTGSVPMLLVWGDQDVMVPAALAEPARQALGPDVPLVRIPRTGHAPYLEAAEAFSTEVRRFLDGANG